MINQQMQNNLIVLLLLIWSTAWKGLALWRAAKSGQKYWFIPILIINALGILEIIYLFKFAKHRLTIKEMQSWLSRPSKTSS